MQLLFVYVPFVCVCVCELLMSVVCVCMRERGLCLYVCERGLCVCVCEFVREDSVCVRTNWYATAHACVQVCEDYCVCVRARNSVCVTV